MRKDVADGKAQTKMMGDYLRECMREHQMLIKLAVYVFGILLALLLAAVRYLSAPVEVSMEMSRTFEDGYSGYKVFCENGQPFFGFTENGEVQRASPIEQSEYDEVMDINFAPYIGGDNMPVSRKAGDTMAEYVYSGTYYRVTVKSRSGKEKSTGCRIESLFGKMLSLSEKYIDTD